jgi:hypothetical protein
MAFRQLSFGFASSPGMSPLENTSSRGEPSCSGRVLRTAGTGFSGFPAWNSRENLRFRGPRGLRKLRHDRNGRPYLLARKVVGPNSTGAAREGRVMLHRSVMTVVLGRQLDCDEFVCHGGDDSRNNCHGGDDSRNNWLENLYLDDRLSNAADSLRRGSRGSPRIFGGVTPGPTPAKRIRQRASDERHPPLLHGPIGLRQADA